jgi:hypothetical protein
MEAMDDLGERAISLRRTLERLQRDNDAWLGRMGPRGLYEAAALLRERAATAGPGGRFSRGPSVERLHALADLAEAEGDRRIAAG